MLTRCLRCEGYTDRGSVCGQCLAQSVGVPSPEEWEATLRTLEAQARRRQEEAEERRALRRERRRRVPLGVLPVSEADRREDRSPGLKQGLTGVRVTGIIDVDGNAGGDAHSVAGRSAGFPVLRGLALSPRVTG